MVCMCVQLNICCVSCVLQKGHSGDGCDFASTLCKYDFGLLMTCSLLMLVEDERGDHIDYYSTNAFHPSRHQERQS